MVIEFKVCYIKKAPSSTQLRAKQNIGTVAFLSYKCKGTNKK